MCVCVCMYSLSTAYVNGDKNGGGCVCVLYIHVLSIYCLCTYMGVGMEGKVCVHVCVSLMQGVPDFKKCYVATLTDDGAKN